MPAVKPPTPAELHGVAARLGMHLTDADVEFFLGTMQGSLAAYAQLELLPDAMPEIRYLRTPGYVPGAAEDPYHAWARKGEIRGAAEGKLAGKRLGLKDNICLAGVPMGIGSSTMEGYVPDLDATVVTRILDAGGVIAGKTECEYLCFSGGSHTCASGPVQNPRKPGYSAGGSSSGSAAAVAAGDVPMAIGGDQGGSIRIPASFCGICGMKPTHGLVPYTGILPLDNTLDHAGPMTATVADNALLLEVLAGVDGLDPRQYGVRPDAYTRALTGDASGMRIAVVREGFGHTNSEAVVDRLVRRGADQFRELGCMVEEVSIPMHLLSPAIWTPIAVEGATWQLMNGNGYGFNWKGLYVTGLMAAHGNWRSHADEMSDPLKATILFGQYVLDKHRGRFYGKAQNLSRVLTAAYDQVLSRYDLLLMPTLPIRATPIPAPDAPRQEVFDRALEMLANVVAFNVTGHPALSLPCGTSDGLPVGLMLVAKHWDESSIYRAAHAFEQSEDWTSVTA